MCVHVPAVAGVELPRVFEDMGHSLPGHLLPKPHELLPLTLSECGTLEVPSVFAAWMEQRVARLVEENPWCVEADSQLMGRQAAEQLCTANALP
jgi:hypothetical protein